MTVSGMSVLGRSCASGRGPRTWPFSMNVSAREEGDRERALAAVVPRGVHVPPRLHPADARPRVDDAVPARALRLGGAALPAVAAAVSEYVTTTERLGRAMLAVVRRSAPK